MASLNTSNKFTFSVKHLQINKEQATLLAAAALAAVFAVFTIVASQALLKQRSYQSRVISAKQKALKQLEDDVTATKTLVASYSQFANASENILGGSPTLKDGNLNGDNPKIVLDALPSKYDFPALATSIEKLATERNLKLEGIGGVDDELIQQKNQSSANPQPVEIPFTLAVSGNYTSIKDIIGVFERSIRPIHVNVLSFDGNDKNLKISITAKSYFQPAKAFNVSLEDVK